MHNTRRRKSHQEYRFWTNIAKAISAEWTEARAELDAAEAVLADIGALHGSDVKIAQERAIAALAVFTLVDENLRKREGLQRRLDDMLDRQTHHHKQSRKRADSTLRKSFTQAAHHERLRQTFKRGAEFMAPPPPLRPNIKPPSVPSSTRT